MRTHSGGRHGALAVCAVLLTVVNRLVQRYGHVLDIALPCF